MMLLCFDLTKLPVFRGCIALAYPGRWASGQNPRTDDIHLQEEVIPRENGGLPLPFDEGLVHFDLDPQNGKPYRTAVEH